MGGGTKYQPYPDKNGIEILNSRAKPKPKTKKGDKVLVGKVTTLSLPLSTNNTHTTPQIFATGVLPVPFKIFVNW